MATVLREGRALLRSKANERLLPRSDSYITGADVLRVLDGPTERQKYLDMLEARPVGTHYVMTDNIREGHATSLGWRHKRQTGQGVFSYRILAGETIEEARQRAYVESVLDYARGESVRALKRLKRGKRVMVTAKAKNAEAARARRAALKIAAMAASEAARQERMARQGMAVAALMRGETND